MPGMPSAESERKVRGIEEVVVDAAVEHVDRFVTACRPHLHLAVDDAQVRALNQFDAHHVGEERMLVIGGIVNARRQHGDARLALAAGRGERGEALAQQVGIILDTLHLVLVEELREHLHHGFPVFQHVADTGGCAGIILQHVKLVLSGAHDVGADDVGVDAAGRPEADHFGDEGDVVFDQLARDAAGADNLLLVVDIVEKGVQRDHPLLDALGEPAPFAGGDDAGNDVEGDEFFGTVGMAVDREGDAGLPEDVFRIAGLGNQMRPVLAVVPLEVFFIRRARTFVPGNHFIKCQKLGSPFLFI